MQRTKPTKRGGPAPTKQAGKTARNRRRRQKRKKQISGGLPQNAGGFSPCANAYLRALSLPFGEFPEPPCIPDTITIPSFKFCARVRGSFSIGTQGVGWCVFNPWQAEWNDGSFGSSVSSFPVKSTATTFTGTNYNWAVSGSTPTTGVAGHNSNSPYAYSYFDPSSTNSNREIRLVGAGLKIMYTGTELNRGGRVVMYRERSNVDIITPQGSAELLRDNAHHFSPVDRSWREVTYLPSRASDLSYVAATIFNPQSDPTELPDRNVLLAYVEGAVAGQSFAFEAIAHYEMVGPNMIVTPSHADPVGHAAIMSAVPQNVQDAGQSMFNSMYSMGLNALHQTASSLLTGAVTATGVGLAINNRRRLRLTNV